ncbi:hypothetical protein BDB01DRAFT_103959 [Pilobolus umbonatus]|nr:hypothetical protein BDB01DRAFT_103959 [Pilobolus umbonatus]
MRTASTNRLSTDIDRSSKNKQEIKPKRPKSVTNKPVGGSRLLREAMLDEARNGHRRVDVYMGSADIPPMPSISKSTILQDLKKNLVRRKVNHPKPVEQSNDSNQVIRKSSQLKISSVIDLPPKDPPPLPSKHKDINISSESFISDCQLFSSSTTTNHSKSSDVDTTPTPTTTTESVTLISNDPIDITPPFIISSVSPNTAIRY